MSSGKFRSKAKNVSFKNPGDHDPAQCPHKLNGKLIHHTPLGSKEGRETIRIDDLTSQRTMIIPNRNPIDLPGIWPKSEYERLVQQSKVVTLADKIAKLEEEEHKKIQLQNESEQRKATLMKHQKSQKAKQGSKLSEVENEATKKNQYVLQRAIELRQEQEEDIKNLNSLILATKCRAIRDAQIAEKELIKKQMEEEEHRLDLMMEQKRQKEIEAAEHKKRQEEEKNQKYVKEVTHQIKENDIRRLIEAERKEEEAKLVNKAMIAVQREEAEKLEAKKENQRKMRGELMKANEELEHFRRIQLEEERIADLRVKEFMRKKAEREEEREKEHEAQRIAKEREIARLRSSQQKAQDATEQMNAMNAARIHEQMEREWRAKELAAAKMRKDKAEDMRLGRLQQIDDIRRAQAMELARDEQEFHEVNKVQKTLHENEMAKKAKKQEEAAKHRKELLKQIDEKERERIHFHKEKFEEGNSLRLEQELHDLSVKNCLHNKLTKLKDTNLPDKYIKDILRQANINMEI